MNYVTENTVRECICVQGRSSNNNNNNNNNNVLHPPSKTKTKTDDSPRVGCDHYKRTDRTAVLDKYFQIERKQY